VASSDVVRNPKVITASEIVMLSVRDVTTAYQGVVAISKVSLEADKREIVCVAGPNGAGKSTLLKSIAGAERARSGTFTFDGARIDGLAQHPITARGVVYVPEERRLFPRLSVRDNLRLGSYLYRGGANREGPLELVFQLFPRLAERLEQARRNALWRRAADARDRARADDAATAVDARRTVAGHHAKARG